MENMVVLLIVLLLLVVAGVPLVMLLKQRKADVLQQAMQGLGVMSERLERTMREEIARSREESTKASRDNREELSKAVSQFGNTLQQQVKDFTLILDQRITNQAALQKEHQDSFSKQLLALTESNEQRFETLRTAVENRLGAIQQDNAKQLEQMRATVDEKLQGTLEKRLGESFKQVSDRLEQVYRGLGEMHTLAAGVGDLKKVLTNVKTRGTWGEVQLGAMLEQVLTPEQFAQNVATKDGSERVEFAIKLPGKGQDEREFIWLPIDAKFPIEDYQRLVDAQDAGDAAAAEAAAKALETRLRQCAKDISDKYINPPKTTDFGVLFLPTEGLFAEALRRNGLADSLQRDCRVVIAGPTTLWSILSSLQMGFRTLAIEKRSSEVWSLLGAVKTEWSRYGEALEKVQKKLQEASDSIDKAQTRTRVIGRKLKDVQQLPAGEAQQLIPEGEFETSSEEIEN